jgi:hypothetical protein
MHQSQGHAGNHPKREHVGKMKALGDDMAATGRKLDDEELVEYILTGLAEDLNPVISTVCARVEPITVGKLYSHVISHVTISLIIFIRVLIRYQIQWLIKF